MTLANTRLMATPHFEAHIAPMRDLVVDHSAYRPGTTSPAQLQHLRKSRSFFISLITGQVGTGQREPGLLFIGIKRASKVILRFCFEPSFQSMLRTFLALMLLLKLSQRELWCYKM